MAGLPSRAGERCAVEQRHRTMTTCHQGRARNASALRPPQAAQPDGRAGCVAAKPPFSTANGGGSVHEPAGPAVCSLPTWRQSAGLCAARRRVAVCMDWLPAARAYTPPPSCPGQGGGKGVFDAEAVAAVGDEHPAGAGGICHHLRRVAILGMVTGESSSMDLLVTRLADGDIGRVPGRPLCRQWPAFACCPHTHGPRRVPTTPAAGRWVCGQEPARVGRLADVGHWRRNCTGLVTAAAPRSRGPVAIGHYRTLKEWGKAPFFIEGRVRRTIACWSRPQ